MAWPQGRIRSDQMSLPHSSDGSTSAAAASGSAPRRLLALVVDDAPGVDARFSRGDVVVAVVVVATNAVDVTFSGVFSLASLAAKVAAVSSAIISAAVKALRTMTTSPDSATVCLGGDVLLLQAKEKWTFCIIQPTNNITERSRFLFHCGEAANVVGRAYVRRVRREQVCV